MEVVLWVFEMLSLYDLDFIIKGNMKICCMSIRSIDRLLRKACGMFQCGAVVRMPGDWPEGSGSVPDSAKFYFVLLLHIFRGFLFYRIFL
jgi:hypothetical protein